jgi:hypothetical protein
MRTKNLDSIQIFYQNIFQPEKRAQEANGFNGQRANLNYIFLLPFNLYKIIWLSENLQLKKLNLGFLHKRIKLI